MRAKTRVHVTHSFPRYLAALLLSLLLCSVPAAAQSGLRVGRITIEAIPLFSSTEAQHGSFYRGANALHVQTRVRLLQRFLLFHEGEPFDAAKLAETERNLRLFDFLKSATVTAGPPHDGLVDVSVVTQDAWTTDVNGDFTNDGGKAAYDFDVTQKDLFGRGSELELHLDKGIDRNANTLEYLDPAIFGPYWNLDAVYSLNSDGNEQKIAIDHPQYSYTAPWTMSFLFDHVLREERIFRNGEVASRVRQQHHQLALWRSKVLQADESGSRSIGLGFDLQHDTFARIASRPAAFVPDNRQFRFLEGGYESTGYRYVKYDYVDRDLREQDFNLGRVTSFRLGVSPPFSGEKTLFRASASQAFGFSLGPQAFLQARFSASSRAPRQRNALLSSDIKFIDRLDTKHPQTLVSRLRIDLGWQLDRDFQLLADGQNGLRAYPDFAFEGNRRILLNVEHRFFLGRELLQIFGPSVAVFADAGEAVRDRPFRLADVKVDAGVGLRIAIARFESALLRFDLAYAFQDSPLSKKGMVFSISTFHAF